MIAAGAIGSVKTLDGGAVRDESEKPLIRERRIYGNKLSDTTISLVMGRDDQAVAALLLADTAEAVIWYNRRLVHGPLLGLVESWGRRAISAGWEFAMLWEQDLAPVYATSCHRQSDTA